MQIRGVRFHCVGCEPVPRCANGARVRPIVRVTTVRPIVRQMQGPTCVRWFKPLNRPFSRIRTSAPGDQVGMLNRVRIAPRRPTVLRPATAADMAVDFIACVSVSIGSRPSGFKELKDGRRFFVCTPDHADRNPGARFIQ
jgi:hypothetical protein